MRSFSITVGAGILSFLSLGILWIGVNQWIQLGVSLLFVGLGYLGAKALKNTAATLTAIIVGIVPLGSIFVMFRDSSGSHALSIAVVLSWVIGGAIGAVVPVLDC